MLGFSDLYSVCNFFHFFSDFALRLTELSIVNY